MCIARTAEVYESGGPKIPFGSDAPGLGAPLGPPPPPSILEGAVGRGLNEEEEDGVGAVVPLPFEVPFPAGVGVGVIVTTIWETTVDSTRPEPKTTAVERNVDRMTEGVGEVALPDAGGDVPPLTLIEGEGTAELGAGCGDDD